MCPALLRAAAANPRRYDRRRPEKTTLYRLVQENLETFLAQVEVEGPASLPQFVKVDHSSGDRHTSDQAGGR